MNFFKKKSRIASDAFPEATNTSPSSNVDSPWMRAQHQHDDTFLRLASHAANWRLFAFCAIGISVLSVLGVIYMGSQSKYIPMLVEVDKLGRTIAVRAVTGNDAITDSSRYVYREMFDLMENLRSVTTDRVANNDRIARGFSRLTGAAETYAKNELRKALPNDVGQTKTIQVKVKTALKLTGKSWQIEWEEHAFTLAGEISSIETWRATLQYELIPSGEEESLRINPVGFVVSDLSWQKVI